MAYKDTVPRSGNKTYFLSPQQLEDLYRRCGRPGELSPGRPATRKRKRLDKTLAALDRKDKNALLLDNENESEQERFEIEPERLH